MRESGAAPAGKSERQKAIVLAEDPFADVFSDLAD
jgi:hypothetical protein